MTNLNKPIKQNRPINQPSLSRAIREHRIVKDSFPDDSNGKPEFIRIDFSEIPSLIYKVVNSFAKLKDVKDEMFWINDVSEFESIIKCSYFGKEILTIFRNPEIDLYSSFPLNKFHPAVHVFEKYSQNMFPFISSFSSIEGIGCASSKDQACQELENLKEIIEKIRFDLKDVDYIKAVNNFQKSATNNEKSIVSYFHKLMIIRKKLCIYRMRLSFRKQSPDPMGEFHDLHSLEYARQCEDYKEDLLKNLTKAWKGQLAGYISKTNYDHYSGFVVHLILIFDGKLPSVGNPGNLVGSHWSKVVTQGTGKFQIYEKKSEEFENFSDFGIGYYEARDMKKFDQLIENVVIFLARTDKYFRFAANGIDSIKKGSPTLADAQIKLNSGELPLPSII